MHDQPSARLENPGHLPEKRLLLGHALGDVLGPDNVEGITVERQISSVALLERHTIREPGDLVEQMRSLEIRRSQVDAGDRASDLVCEHPCGAAKSGPNVEHSLL